VTERCDCEWGRPIAPPFPHPTPWLLCFKRSAKASRAGGLAYPQPCTSSRPSESFAAHLVLIYYILNVLRSY